ncbi:MAG: AEC family transporter [Notoacmeibacter sp.]
MSTIFASILPIFLLIVGGYAIKSTGVMEEAGWRALDQLSFYVLYPVLLFVSIVGADFSTIAVFEILAVIAGSWLIVGLVLTLVAPRLISGAWIEASQYSSVFQTTVRWNGFIALAIAERLFGPQSMAVVALVMAGLVLPINLAAIYVVTSHSGENKQTIGGILRRMATNPIVLGCLGALFWRSTGLVLFEPFMTTLDLISRGALAMGLFGIGAGLSARALLKFDAAHVLPVLFKLFLMPLIAFLAVSVTGLGDHLLPTIVLCCAVPTAMNGYVVARQMGGDAPLYAAIVTTQTLLSFFTIPFWLMIAGV